MKIKLDENLPAALAKDLRQLDHDVDTASDGRFLVTQDLDFSDIRMVAKRAPAGVLIIRLAEPSRSRLTRRVAEIFEAENVESWTGCLVVATDRKIRVRRV